MESVKTSWNMFNMQISTHTDNYDFWKNVAVDKNDIVTKRV